MIPDSRMKDTEVLKLLLGDVKYIDLIPFERKYLMRKVRKRLTSLLWRMYHEMNGWKPNVKTKYGELDIDTYLHRFTKNLFDCLISLVNCVKFRKGIFDAYVDIPDKVFHGTSTKFLSEIIKDGLLPSKAGQCWKEDKDKKPQKVCLTDSMYAAEMYAVTTAKRVGGEPVVIVFDIRGLREKMKIRVEKFRLNGPITPFDVYKEIYFNEPISADRIKNWYFVPKKSAFMVLNICKEYIRNRCYQNS